MAKEAATEPSAVGGLAFFFSLIALGLLSISNFIALPRLVVEGSFRNLLIFSMAAIGGGVIGLFIIAGRGKVFIHELKHSLVSGLVGNRWSEMKVKSRSGHFEYAYTKQTARFHAFIALAPYWFPLFTALFALLGVATAFRRPDLLLAWIGAGYGLDLALHLRDMGPHQTDINTIRGGYGVGLAYIFVINVFIGTVLLSWVLGGVPGVKHLGISLWTNLLAMVHLVRESR